MNGVDTHARTHTQTHARTHTLRQAQHPLRQMDEWGAQAPAPPCERGERERKSERESARERERERKSERESARAHMCVREKW